MKKTKSRLLRGDALLSRAEELGIAAQDFQGADGTVDEDRVRWRVREVERYSADFRVGVLFAVCVAAFLICGLAAGLAVSWLGHR